MIFLRLFLEFFRVGLFSVGGGLAAIPFLADVGNRTGWFTQTQLMDMIAVSESTPGPIGVNMATYTGFLTAGPVGCVVATLGFAAPSVLIILMIARFLRKFRQSRGVDAVFYGLRPASVALITAAGISVAQISLFSPLNWEAILLAVAVFVCLQVKPLKKLHPIVFIALSAVVGVVLQF
jgi:chromate transporter